jgi:hypothetical protein
MLNKTTLPAFTEASRGEKEMRRILFFLSILTILTGNLYGIGVGFNGEDWNTFSKMEAETDKMEGVLIPETYKMVKVIIGSNKTQLIRGIYAGAWAVSTIEGEKKLHNVYYWDTSVENIVSAVDQFYSDYRNVKIPVSMALMVVRLELTGEDKAVIDKFLRGLRSASSKGKHGK